MQRYHRLAVSTSLRSGRRAGARGEEISGSLLIGYLDLQESAFRVTHQRELPESPHLPGRRSVRGVACFGSVLAACNTSQLFLLDADTREIVAVYSDERLGDIHSICAHDGLLYVTATASDCLIVVDQNLRKVREWWAGDDQALAPYMRDWQRTRFRENHDFRCDLNPGARFHMNHVCVDRKGDVLVTLPGMAYREGKSRVYNVTRQEFLFDGKPIPDAVRGRVHDGIALDESFYLCRTATGDFIKLDQSTGALLAVVNCSVPLDSSSGDQLALEHGWLRGAVHLEDEIFLVGQSKLTLLLADMRLQSRSGPVSVEGAEGELDDPGLAVYCIARLPDD